VRFYARTSRRTGVSVGPFGALLVGCFWLLVIGLLIKFAVLVLIITAGFVLWFGAMVGLGMLYVRWAKRER
jgi:hypothetical protein